MWCSPHHQTPTLMESWPVTTTTALSWRGKKKMRSSIPVQPVFSSAQAMSVQEALSLRCFAKRRVGLLFSLNCDPYLSYNFGHKGILCLCLQIKSFTYIPVSNLVLQISKMKYLEWNVIRQCRLIQKVRDGTRPVLRSQYGATAVPFES